MKILIIAEHDEHALKSSSYHLLGAAQELHGDIDVLAMGNVTQDLQTQLQRLPHIKQVLIANQEVYHHQLAENCAALIAKLATNYEYVMMAATTFGKNILPRVAALLDVAMVSDITKILTNDTFERPIYAGNAIATVQVAEKIKLLSIRTTAFPVIKEDESLNTPVVEINDVFNNDLSSFIGQSLTESKRPELAAAKIVVAGGRGLKSAENFKLLEKLADQLGAAIGASRAAVDAGYAPNDYQVGQTGKVVAPDLYIAVGISGAIQHVAGMKDSKVIVAINSDAEAPIFQLADYYLVGDLFVILPELSEELSAAISS